MLCGRQDRKVHWAHGRSLAFRFWGLTHGECVERAYNGVWGRAPSGIQEQSSWWGARGEAPWSWNPFKTVSKSVLKCFKKSSMMQRLGAKSPQAPPSRNFAYDRANEQWLLVVLKLVVTELFCNQEVQLLWLQFELWLRIVANNCDVLCSRWILSDT